MATFDTTLYRENKLGTTYRFPIYVEYTYHKASRGTRDSIAGMRGAGPPLEQDEPERIDIESILDANGKEIEVSDSEMEKIEKQIWEEIYD